MQQLENTINKLKEVLPPRKAKWGITVLNKDSLHKVVCNQTGDELAKTYGSVEAFFEHLHATGINNVRIYDRKQNGNGFKAVSEYDCNFSVKNNPVEKMQEPIHQAPVQQANQVQNYMVGNGLAGVQGLGFADIYKLQDHSRLQGEYSDLKAEHKLLKEQHEKLKEENLRNDILGTKSVEKASANNELVEKLMPLAMALGQKFLSPATPAPGLNGAVLSPIRQQFVSIAQNADETLLEDLSIIIQGMQNPDFDTDLTELCKKHNLISD